MSKSGIQTLAAHRSDLLHIAPADVHIVEGWNARDFTDPANIEHVEALATSIAAVGVKKPLQVRWSDGKALLTDGESRLRAVRLAIERGAEIKTVPVINASKHDSDADHVLMMIVGNSGKNLTPLETANVFKRLVDFGWSETEIATKAGMSKQRVGDLLALRAAPAAITDKVRSGEVTATLAQQVIRDAKGDTAAAAETLTTAVTKAKAAGKTRATASDVKPSLKKELKAIFGRASVIPGGMMFTTDDVARLRVLFKIKG